MTNRQAIALTSVILLTCAALPADADITIQWSTTTGSQGAGRVYDHLNAERLAVGSIIQLIWTSDMLISQLDPYDPLTPTGGETALFSSTIGTGSPSTDGGFGMNLNFDDSYAGGYVYSRIFENVVTPLGETPTIGDWYVDSPLSPSGPLTITTSDPTTVNIADPTYGGGDISCGIPIVPEPGTMALFGIGLGTLALRTFRRRAKSEMA